MRPIDPPITAMLFDFDGTLFDTAPAITHALNHVLNFHGCPTISVEKIRPVAGLGTTAILKTSLEILKKRAVKTQMLPPLSLLKQQLLNAYQHGLYQTNENPLFPGMEDILRTLRAKKIPWGVVTNKPNWLAKPILDALVITEDYQCLIAGDTFPLRKPHPEPLHYACQYLQQPPQTVLYVGDSENDWQAGCAAHIRTVIITYKSSTQFWHKSQKYQPIVSIDCPLELLSYLR